MAQSVSSRAAFTLPLPLFPRLIAWYLSKEGAQSSSLLSQLLGLTHTWRATLLSWSPIGGRSVTLAPRLDPKNWDVVLLGGAMGSLFSFCQCIISPKLGQRESAFCLAVYPLTIVSDRYGRKKVLVATMMGNILSAVIWLRSTSFVSLHGASVGSADRAGFVSAVPGGRRSERRQCTAQHVS